jgi:hypothetical protein
MTMPFSSALTFFPPGKVILISITAPFQNAGIQLTLTSPAKKGQFFVVRSAGLQPGKARSVSFDTDIHR